MTAAELYEARRQATSATARRIPATVDDAICADIIREIADADAGHTIRGYELAQQLINDRIPNLSPLQRKTLASTLSKAAA